VRLGHSIQQIENDKAELYPTSRGVCLLRESRHAAFELPKEAKLDVSENRHRHLHPKISSLTLLPSGVLSTALVDSKNNCIDG
jgi:hypothetical protein